MIWNSKFNDWNILNLDSFIWSELVLHIFQFHVTSERVKKYRSINMHWQENVLVLPTKVPINIDKLRFLIHETLKFTCAKPIDEILVLMLYGNDFHNNISSFGNKK